MAILMRGSMAGVHIEGLPELLAGLKEADPEGRKALRKALRESVRPVLNDARASASAIADDGTFASSLSLGSRKGGAMWLLKSTDPAAGVKEYAHPGAVTRSGRRAGVPAGGPPRAMVPAVLDNADDIERAMQSALEETLDRAVRLCRARA